MKTKEEKKVIRAFELFIVWVLFFAATVSGLLFAGARTDAVHTGREAETVKVIRNKNHREQTTACGDVVIKGLFCFCIIYNTYS